MLCSTKPFGLADIVPSGHHVVVAEAHAIDDQSESINDEAACAVGDITCVEEHLTGASGKTYTIVGRDDGSFELYDAE